MNYRPNIRPNYSVKLAEYSVSADTNFCRIGRTLYSSFTMMSFEKGPFFQGLVSSRKYYVFM